MYKLQKKIKLPTFATDLNNTLFTLKFENFLVLINKTSAPATDVS